MANPSPEIVCAGELLLDLISTEYADSFRDADTYRRFPGGSPANLAMNLARLGRNVGLLATVGQDDAGALLLETTEAAGVNVAAVRRVPVPTTMILVTKSKEVSQFEAYRSADTEILPEQVAEDYLSEVKIFHTTAFALSREPARSTILELAAQVVASGGQLSIDINYANKIWPDRLEALWTINQYVALGGEGSSGTLVKASDVDYVRLFDEPLESREEGVERLHDLGAGIVCLTLGAEGCYVSSDEGVFAQDVREVDVKDTTGAGDAFWSGFLAGRLVGYDLRACAQSGRAMAERKLTTVGPLTSKIELSDLQ